ncbi:MAG TPA: hypothetical protein VFV38_17980 [Ktedonobacteraceae bacterium]|nr:hypothetical protein [Ktedonobacteraceae bacterium]
MSTPAKHTPAPWKFAGFRKASNFADHTAIVQADNCNLVSVRGGVKDEKSVAEANARLIAAAPELLEENEQLKSINAELLEALKQSDTAHKAFSRHYEGTHLHKRTSVAIAKAEDR